MSCVGPTTFVLTNEAKEQIDRAVVEVNDKKGYVTSGVAIRDELSVSETDIVLKRVDVK